MFAFELNIELVCENEVVVNDRGVSERFHRLCLAKKKKNYDTMAIDGVIQYDTRK